MRTQSRSWPLTRVVAYPVVSTLDSNQELPHRRVANSPNRLLGTRVSLVLLSQGSRLPQLLRALDGTRTRTVRNLSPVPLPNWTTSAFDHRELQDSVTTLILLAKS